MTPIKWFSIILASTMTRPCHCAEDGLARTPPMGWRSWNQYGKDVDQHVMESTASALTVKRDVNGNVDEKNGVSLMDLGYDDVGLDDFWQDCGKGVGNSFHDEKGVPLVNKDLFPDMKGMVDRIHGMGLKAGWYHNNCICREKNPNLWNQNDHIIGDVEATVAYGFDSVKLDGCGAFRDLDLWYDTFATNRTNSILIENCHWGGNPPTLTWCPFHMFRTSGDIKANWRSFFGNLQSTRKFQDLQPLSRPGCWAYPDMLEVGKLATEEEDRAHFGAWVITSSPLILGHNVTDEATTKKIWPIIANQAAIAINQDWAGHPGRMISEFKGTNGRTVQIWFKPLQDGSAALFLLNDNDKGEDLVKVSLESLELPSDHTFKVFNVWKGFYEKNVIKDGLVIVTVEAHSSSLLRLDPVMASQGREELV